MPEDVQGRTDWIIEVAELPMPGVIIVPDLKVIVIDPREVERRMSLVLCGDLRLLPNPRVA
jgi:hypothetical protein